MAGRWNVPIEPIPKQAVVFVLIDFVLDINQLASSYSTSLAIDTSKDFPFCCQINRIRII